MDNQLTALDLSLQEMAVNNWPQFVELLGEQNVLAAKIRMLCIEGKTYGQIQNRLNVTKRAAQWNCGRCNIEKE